MSPYTPPMILILTLEEFVIIQGKTSIPSIKRGQEKKCEFPKSQGHIEN